MLSRTVSLRGCATELRAPSEAQLDELQEFALQVQKGEPPVQSFALAGAVTRVGTVEVATREPEERATFSEWSEYHQREGETVQEYAQRLYRLTNGNPNIIFQADGTVVRFVDFLCRGGALGLYRADTDEPAIVTIETSGRTPEAIRRTTVHELAHSLGLLDEQNARLFATAWLEMHYSGGRSWA